MTWRWGSGQPKTITGISSSSDQSIGSPLSSVTSIPNSYAMQAPAAYVDRFLHPVEHDGGQPAGAQLGQRVGRGREHVDLPHPFEPLEAVVNQPAPIGTAVYFDTDGQFR